MISIDLVTTPEWAWFPVVAIFVVGVFTSARIVIGWLDRFGERIKQRRTR